MRAELVDDCGQMFTVDSQDPKLIGAWFAEHANQLMSSDASMPDCRLRIWPRTNAEFEYLRLAGPRDLQVTQDDLAELARSILDVAEKIGARESAS